MDIHLWQKCGADYLEFILDPLSVSAPLRETLPFAVNH